MNQSEAIEKIQTELARAKCIHPRFPAISVISMVAIMAEEAGEAIKAANDVIYKGESTSNLKSELIQTGAMVLRCLENL